MASRTSQDIHLGGHDRILIYSETLTKRLSSTWRPYGHTVEDCPLALCDGSTFRQSDLVICSNVQKTRLGETLLPLYSPDANLCYLNRRGRDDVTIIKIFDSVVASCMSLSLAMLRTTQLIATGGPHTAFHHIKIPEGASPRQSIEMRALIFTKPDPDGSDGSTSEIPWEISEQQGGIQGS